MKRAVVGDVTLIEEEPGIVTIDYGTAIATAELVQDVVDRSREDWGDRRVAVLVKANSATDLAKIGKILSAYDLSAFTIASAILTPGKLTQLIGNLFMQFQNSPFPQRQFVDLEEARDWLRQQISADQSKQRACN
jgi:hypothetical protein